MYPYLGKNSKKLARENQSVDAKMVCKRTKKAKKKKRQTNKTKTMKRKNSKDIKQHTKMKIRYNPAWGRRAQVRTNAPRLAFHIIRTTDFRRNEDECPYPRKVRNLERGASGRHIRPKHRHRHKRICGWPR